MRRQRGTSPNKLFVIHIVHIVPKLFVPSVLKHYNEVFLNVLHEEIRSIMLFQNRVNMV